VAAAAATIAGCGGWARGLTQLHLRHPHEDALILFRYAENLARGSGIVFNVGGPPTEGATDFLWLVLLSALHRLGFDVAVAAVALNACGSALIAWLLYAILNWAAPRRVEARVLALALAALVPFIGGANASYDGFSVQFNAAVVLLEYALLLGVPRRRSAAVPYVALILGLIRPDGVVVGAAAFGALVVRQRRRARLRRELLVHGLVAGALGATYFIARAYYFGELLPLPLYVKARGPGSLPGWELNRSWLFQKGGVLPLLLLCAALFALRLRSNARARRALFAALPGVFLFLALTFAHQSQNVDFRFQAPIFTIALGMTVALTGLALSKSRDRRLRIAWSLGLLVAVWPNLWHQTQVWPLDYVDTLAVELGKSLRHERIVLTEAGRVPYWTRSTAYDMVGLNNPVTARHPPSERYIESLEPDLVMYHVAGTLDFGEIPGLVEPATEGQSIQLDPRTLLNALSPELRASANQGAPFELEAVMPTQAAAAALTEFLGHAQDFDAFLLNYGGSFNHVWAVRRGRAFTSSVESLLRRADRLSYSSYARAKDLHLGRGLCPLVLASARTLGFGAFALLPSSECQ
jgi:hypothetical protein